MKYKLNTETLTPDETVDIPKGSICIDTRLTNKTIDHIYTPVIVVSWLEPVKESKEKVRK